MNRDPRRRDVPGQVLLEGSDPVLIKDLQGVILDVNPAAEEVYGWSREEMIGRDIRTIVPDEWRDRALRMLEKARTGAPVRDILWLRRTKHGDVVPVLLSLSVLSDGAGRPVAIATVAKDGRYGFLFGRAPVPVWEEDWSSIRDRLVELRDAGADVADTFVDDPEALRDCLRRARFVEGNDAFHEQIGHDEDDRGDVLVEIVTEASLRRVAGLLAGLAEGRMELHCELDVTTRAGQERCAIAYLRVHPAYRDSLSSVLLSVVDVTAVKEAELALLRGEASMRALLDTSGEGIVTADEQGRIEAFNGAAERMFGYRASEVVGSNLRVLMPPEHADRHAEYMRRYLQTGEARILGIGREVEGLRKDGTRFPLYLDVGEASTGSHRRFVGMLHDLTERKELERELLQAQKLEAVGRLAGGIAHDFNNLLAGVLFGCKTIDKQLGPDHPARELLGEIQEELSRGAGLTRQLLDFSRKRKLELKPVDLTELVAGSRDMLQRLIGEDVELVIEHPDHALTVLADSGQIHQVLMNLAVNARDAMPDGGRLRIELAESAAPRDDRRRVALRVTDTGAGMDETTRQRAFDPFYTTKAPGKGTGLGLSTVFGLVKSFDGSVELESTPGRGTTVTLSFPLCAPASAGAEEEPEQANGADPGTVGTVLVVEDEALVRAGIRVLLAERGYRVLTAKEPLEALRLLEENGASIDLLLTDMVMPNMNGAELARRVLQERPSVRVLYMSAFSAEALTEQGRLPPGAEVCEKPFTDEELARRVANALA